MKAVIRIGCACGQIIDGQFDVVERSLKATCPQCGDIDDGSVDLNFHIGRALIGYAEKMLSSDDTNFSILLSGMAIDCYLSRLYYKWRMIEEMEDPAYTPEKTHAKIQKEFENIHNFLKKVNKVERLLYPKGTKEFIDSKPELKQEIVQGFPNIKTDSFALSVRNQVMWKRNNIIHIAQSKYPHEEAVKTLNYSKIFIKVFESMDKIKSIA